MSHSFSAFAESVRAASPQSALVLGSGLGAAADHLRVLASIAYADIPGLVPPTVAGHRGRLDLCESASGPALVAHGRVHSYEGHPVERVTRLVNLFAEFGAKRLLLTNAAGGLNPSFEPGDLLVIDRHWKLLNSGDWKRLGEPTRCYSPAGLDIFRRLSARFGSYAALTGPCYETPAEIRALAACGVDAVGMSTAVEAEAAVELGLEVLAISCITNKAAGITAHPLSHAEVEINAKLGIARLRTMIDAAFG